MRSLEGKRRKRNSYLKYGGGRWHLWRIVEDHWKGIVKGEKVVIVIVIVIVTNIRISSYKFCNTNLFINCYVLALSNLPTHNHPVTVLTSGRLVDLATEVMTMDTQNTGRWCKAHDK